MAVVSGVTTFYTLLRRNLPQPSGIGAAYPKRRSRSLERWERHGQVGRSPSCVVSAPVIGSGAPLGGES